MLVFLIKDSATKSNRRRLKNLQKVVDGVFVCETSGGTQNLFKIQLAFVHEKKSLWIFDGKKGHDFH